MREFWITIENLRDKPDTLKVIRDKHTNLKIQFKKQRLERLIQILKEEKIPRCERFKNYWADKNKINKKNPIHHNHDLKGPMQAVKQ